MTVNSSLISRDHVSTEDPLDTIIRDQGVALVQGLMENSAFLYTIGNTQHSFPELMMFYKERTLFETGYILVQMSIFMQRTEACPISNGRLTFRKKSYHSLLAERSLVAPHVRELMFYYVSSPKISVIQLLIPDSDGVFPDSPNYNCKEMKQPIFRYH